MAYLEAAGLAHVLPDGRELFVDVSLRVSDGDVVALVGANGAGKTTLLRTLAGELPPAAGGVHAQGGVAVMPQFIGSARRQRGSIAASDSEQGADRARSRANRTQRDGRTVHDLLLAVSPAPLQAAASELDAAERAMMDLEDDRTQLRYAHALTTWGEAGGYAAEVLWDTVTTAALGVPYDRARFRDVRTLSGGEQKRLVLEALLRGPEGVLLLDEPDNYLDVPGKRWLEDRLAETTKAVLLISHDRELLANAATHIVALEGRTTWTHGGSFASWHGARAARRERLAELHRRWAEEHVKLRELVRRLQQAAAANDSMASRYHAAQTRLRKFEESGPPPELPLEESVRPRLVGGRTGVRVITCRQLELVGLMRPFDLEVFLGNRVCALGSNGSGKSHLLRLLAESGSVDVASAASSWTNVTSTASERGGSRAPSVAFTGECRLGARVRPGLFAQTHEHPEWIGRTLADILWRGDGERDGRDRGSAISALRRYGLASAIDQRFDTLSGGQQARLQVLLLELSGCTLLLLDEPTDNLDLTSAEALQDALEEFIGTVVAATHDRWFARGFDRYLLFRADGTVVETSEPVWDEARVARAR